MLDKLKWITEKRKISDLIPAEYNPRQMTEAQAKELKKSLEKFDLVEIPAVDKDGTILAGHQRLSILKLMGRGEEEIDVRVPNRKLSDAEAKEYNLRSNKNTGEWDMDKLFAMPEDLLKDVGFSDKEIQKLIDGHTEAKEDDYDLDKGLQMPVRVEKGDIWQLGSHRLMCGDSTAKEDVARLMNGKKEVDITLLTDPPYGINYDPKWLSDIHIAKGSMPNKSDAKIIGDEKPFDASICWKYPKRLVWGFPYLLDEKATGWIVWDKQPKIDWRGITTPVEVASTTLRKGYDLVHCMWAGFMREKIEGEERTEHPTQKPLKVIQGCITQFVKDDIILDLFGGSGSTLIACEQTKRICYMMEIDPKYCTVILDRWSKLTGKEPTKVC